MMCRKVRKSSGSSEAASPSTAHSAGVFAATPQSGHLPCLYLINLPFETGEHYTLESLIRSRIEKNFKIPVASIRCYSKLGVGVIHVTNEDDKNTLINDIDSFHLHPKDGNIMIKFVNTLKLLSYVVIDVTTDLGDRSLPKAGEVAQGWRELFQEQPSQCVELNNEFPNIFQVVSSSLDALVSKLDHTSFRIRDRCAQVYFCANCSFLEDLSSKTSQDQLRLEISDSLHLPLLSLSSLYVQLNKQAATACVIVTDEARKWSTATAYLLIDGKATAKKDHISHRLLIRSVPSKAVLKSICQHSSFIGKLINCKPIGQDVILEITDRQLFDILVRKGAFQLDADHVYKVEAYVPSNNPEASEIDGTTWYESEMLRYKPDIMQFLPQPQHAIFRYRWNPHIWLEQYLHAGSEKVDDSFGDMRRERGRGDGANETRHRLLVTVMLNTFGTLLKKSYLVDDRPVALNLNNQLKTIVYTHRSKLQLGGKRSLTLPTHPKTRVEVANEDCMVIYERLVKKGKQPLLLNMASATSPGGGFRKGDGAQEENLFRRSDYCRSLDIGVEQFLPLKSQRFYCSPTGQLDPITDPTKMYPMDEYGAIYTSGLTFFRQTQDVGYAYMKKPLENVCAVAMAAYRDPKLDGKYLAGEYAVGTRKKIENIFAIAHHHKHDSLVLSAFGCGAFRNPPDHLAELFFSVIEQYAGYFETIVFAIIDDHNAGGRLNPEGNFKPFARVLDGQVPPSVSPTNKPNTISGPYRVLTDGSTVGDVQILYLPPCKYGGKCRDTNNAGHIRQYSHPPRCTKVVTTGKCDLTDDYVHMMSFLHRNQCQYGGMCRTIDDERHTREVEHPSYCPKGGDCREMDESHLKQYRHLPLCRDSQKCPELNKGDKKHCSAFRHCKTPCPYRNFCANFHDQRHMKDFLHPFPKPCPATPFNCAIYQSLCDASDRNHVSDEIREHCQDFAHVCRHGRLCADPSSEHWKTTIHIARPLCPYGDKCRKLTHEDHLNSFTHPTIADVRSSCRNKDKCNERHRLDHIKKYRHQLSKECSGIVRYYGLNKGISFVRNQCSGLVRIHEYTKREKWASLTSGSIPQETLDWIRTVQPVHRCRPLIFESILLLGHVMSRDYMESLRRPRFVAFTVLQHPRIRRIQDINISNVEQHVREYITAFVTLAYEKAKLLGSGSASSSAHVLKSEELNLRSLLQQNDFDALKLKTDEITRSCIKLNSEPAGIGYPPDKDLGTDKRVFSVLGPHLGHYYGDVILVFKREILHHPDADFYPQAATTAHSGSAFKMRPWLGDDPQDLSKRIAFYHYSKLHASIPGYERVIGLELMALTSRHSNQKTMDIKLKDILDRAEKVDSHLCVEAHLPQLIPLEYIDRIFIPKNLFDSLSKEAHRTIKVMFEHRIDITPHQGEATHDSTPGKPTPKSKARADYQSYVISKLREQYERDAKMPRSKPLRGAFITIPASAFTDNYLLPVTISQVYTQYQIEHQKAPTDDIAYVYWQVTTGDMILALSTKPIEAKDGNPVNARCLICYIAPQGDAQDGTYHEQTTYLNCGLPIRHFIFEHHNQYLAKSKTFHKGCNPTDFLTYCLEIHRSTGRVTLRHAGANSIYNHEEITYDFKKDAFDLSKLEFVQVTANGQVVTVKDLIVCFNQQPDLHPTIDTQCKPGPPTPGTGPDVKLVKPKEPSAAAKTDDPRSPCQWGSSCRTISDANHRAQYSHPKRD